MTLLLITVIALANLAISFFVYIQNRIKVVNKTFALLGFIVTLWAIGQPFLRITGNFIFSDFLLATSFLTLATFVFFVFIFPKGQIKSSYYWVFIPAAIMLALMPMRLFISGMTIGGDGSLQPINGILFPLVPIFLAGNLLVGSYNLFKKYRRSVGTEKSQIFYLLIGTSIFLVGAIALDGVLPALGIFRFMIWGPLFVIFMLGFTAYSIVAHRLFDIRVIIRKTVIFTGLLAFMLAIYAVVVIVASSLLGGGGIASLTLRGLTPSLIVGTIIALSFNRLRNWLTEITDSWLFKGEYRQEEVLKSLAGTLANVIDIDEAIKGMITVVVDQMRLMKAVVFMLHPNAKKHEHELRGVVKNGEFDESTLALAPQDVLIEYFEIAGINHIDAIIIEELQRFDDNKINPFDQTRKDFLKRSELLGVSVVMPLIISRQEPVATAPGTPTQTKEVKNLIGILALGAKKSGDTFSDQDLKMLQIVANETAAAIEKGRFFEEDRLKTEFVSIASHELLTPTTSMKGYLSMILDEGIGKVDPTARGYLEKVYSETNRLAILVKDLLNVSRIERGKIVVELAEHDILPIVQHAVETQELKAEELGVLLKLELPKQALPQVSVDSDKIMEVLINIIGNGLKYTKKGSVTISFNVTSTQVMVSVTDTGIGIGPNDMRHLFGKFFRASNSDETGQTGTGLGLYVSKYMTELMGGTIAVDSTVGKGTIFTVLLPIAKAESVEKKQTS